MVAAVASRSKVQHCEQGLLYNSLYRRVFKVKFCVAYYTYVRTLQFSMAPNPLSQLH